MCQRFSDIGRGLEVDPGAPFRLVGAGAFEEIQIDKQTVFPCPALYHGLGQFLRIFMVVMLMRGFPMHLLSSNVHISWLTRRLHY